MKALKTSLALIVGGCAFATALHGQNTISPPPLSASQIREAKERQSALRGAPQTGAFQVPKAFQGRPALPAAPFLFLASGRGRGLLEATHHPLAQYLSQALGENADAPIPPSAATMRQLATMASSNRISTNGTAGTVTCTGSAGARFNLEPRANAVPQTEEMADFIPSGVAPGDDLIVQVADDFRGNLATDPNWGPERQRILRASLHHG
jgi:hypothetical protein